MNREELIQMLSQAPYHLMSAERAVLESETERTAAAAALQAKEDALLLAGAIDGKNEALRAAQLREATAAERDMLNACEREIQLQKIVLHRRQADLSAMKAIARLLSGAE
jgi:hypothetical protein